MTQLISSSSDMTATLAENLAAHKRTLVTHLMRGWPLIVPYDADGNHEPTTKRGHKAHWAIIVGFCLVEMPQTISDGDQGEHMSTAVQHLSPTTPLSEAFFNLLDSKHARLIVYAKQGKSKYVRAWSFDKLYESNTNLMEVDPKLDDVNYVIPTGRDLRNHLCNRFIFIKPADV